MLICRVYCQLLRPQLERVLAEQPPANRAFFDLLEFVHQLELQTLQWCPSLLGEALLHVDVASNSKFSR